MSEHNEHAGMTGSKLGAAGYPRDVERIVDISGPTVDGRTKAHVLLHYYDQYSDGTIKDIQIMSIDKPIVNIFKHSGFVNVYLDFGSRFDHDLKVMYDLLTEYKKPSNSVSYLPEELESGYYETPEGPKMVYFPVLNLALSPIGKEDVYMIHGYNPAFFTLGVLNLALSPIGKEDVYMIHGYNPAFFTLAPSQIHGDVCVIQFTFMEETFSVVNELKRVDPHQIQHEVMQELEAEQRGYAPLK